MLRIYANRSDGSEVYPDKIAINLSPTLYLTIRAKVMILWNINTSLGLVNGAAGIVKDFLYKNGDKAINDYKAINDM